MLGDDGQLAGGDAEVVLRLGDPEDESIGRGALALPSMAGHSGSPKISGRAFRVFEISGFENRYPKFARNKQNPIFRVPENSGSGSGYPEIPEAAALQPTAGAAVAAQ